MDLPKNKRWRSQKVSKLFEDMRKQACEFYENLKINVPPKDIDLAVRSLTMPQYAKVYNDKNDKVIKDCSALATVGDAVCEAYVMLKEYSDELTSQELHDKKAVLSNKMLNSYGKKILNNNVLFAKNNDLVDNDGEDNKKAYATAFEAFIGFIALLDERNKTNYLGDVLYKYFGNAN